MHSAQSLAPGNKRSAAALVRSWPRPVCLLLAVSALALFGEVAQAQLTAKRTWTNNQGKSEETEFQKLLPGGVAVFKAKSARPIQVPLTQLAAEDQEIAKLLFLAQQTDVTEDETLPMVSPFGQLTWEDTPGDVLTKLHADGYERITARIKKNVGRDEYDVPIINVQQNNDDVANADDQAVDIDTAKADDGSDNSDHRDKDNKQDEQPPQMTLSMIPLDAAVMLVGVKPAVLASDWTVIIEAGPVWIEGSQCNLIATFESNYALLVDQKNLLEKVSLPDDGAAVGPKECVLPCFLSTVTIEYAPETIGIDSGFATSSVKSLHSVLMEKYRPLMETNLRLAGVLSANFGDRPDQIFGRAGQLLQLADSLPSGQNRANLQPVFSGSENGFRMELTDAAGHSIATSVGRIQGTRSGLTIRYNVGDAVRSTLKKKADEADFRTSGSGKNRARDI